MRQAAIITVLILLAVSAHAQAPASSTSDLPRIERPEWLVRPSPAEIGEAYPARAFGRGIGGNVMLRCVAELDGKLSSCEVASETPPDMGFGSAAMRMRPIFQMKPPTVNGAPARGIVTIPVQFRCPACEPGRNPIGATGGRPSPSRRGF